MSRYKGIGKWVLLILSLIVLVGVIILISRLIPHNRNVIAPTAKETSAFQVTG